MEEVSQEGRRRVSEDQGDCLVYGDSLSWAICHDAVSRHPNPWPLQIERRLQDNGLRLVQSNFYERTTCYDDFPVHSFGWNHMTEPHDFNGFHHFGTVFSSHSPRWVVLMLGTHDTKRRVRDLAWRRNLGAVCRDSDSESQFGECDHLDQPAQEERTQKRSKEESDRKRSSENTAFEMDANLIAENCMKIARHARLMIAGHCHSEYIHVVCVVPPLIKLTPFARELGFDERSVEITRSFPEAFERACTRSNVLLAYDRDISMELSKDGVHLTDDGHQMVAELVWRTIKTGLPRQSKQPDRFQAKH